MDSAEDGADDGADDVHGGPDDGQSMIDGQARVAPRSGTFRTSPPGWGCAVVRHRCFIYRTGSVPRSATVS